MTSHGVRGAILVEASLQRSVEVTGENNHRWIGWAPLVILPGLVITLRAKLVPWAFMWSLAAAIFWGCKWLTWWQARSSSPGARNWMRSAAYLLMYPGMDAWDFLGSAREKQRIHPTAWLAAVSKALAGVALVRVGGRLVSARHPLAGGWVGMLGIVLFLHFGTFHLVALAWQRAGTHVKPIMQRPLASRSLSELWGKRWNLGFRALSHRYVFHPLQQRFGPAAGTLGTFLASGLLHDLVISVPARAGYGLPTAYFLTQGLAVIAERSRPGRRLGLGHGVTRWLWTALIAIGPLFALFHPWFVMRVIVPFLRAVAG
jgi:alginate O-acetyltransferase complex protein AlgI